MVCAPAPRPVLAVCAALAAVALAAGLPLAVAAQQHQQQQQQQQQPLWNARPSAAPQAAGDALAPVRTHSLYAPFVDQNLRNQWFDFGGDAIVDSNKHIRLTPDRPSQMGWLWSKLPLTVPNWQVEFEFRIGNQDKGVLFGDGLAFWATTERSQPGPVFGNKQNFTGLGIFFDTYANGRNTHAVPYVIAMLGDGRTEYDQKNDGEKNKLASCEANVRNKDFPTKARIKFTKGGVLEVDLLYKSPSKWTRCFEIKDIILPIAPYIGFTAITGDVHDAHDIISVTTSSVIMGRSAVPLKEARATRPFKKSGRSFSFFGWTLWFVVIALVAGVLVTVFRMNQQDAKRF